MFLLDCRLPDGYKIYRQNDKYYIAGNKPKRRVTLSENIYRLLERLLSGEQAETAKKENQALLYLAHKNYLNLETKPLDQTGFTFPLVSVIIPVKDRAKDLYECLESVKSISWPADKLEIIVIDDGSSDDSPLVAANAGAVVIKNPKSLGPAAARNKGASVAKGQILAFIDSDCIAENYWLSDLVPWLLHEPVGAVGGLVASYYNNSPLDRYEEACSSLSISKRFLYEDDTDSNFYVPTCNMLVKKDLFNKVGGFNPAMHLGEDVDLCWRLRENGAALIYTPTGKVWHKHRNALKAMLKRKLQYGTSEADLYKRHREKHKTFPLSIMSLAFYLGIAAALVSLSWIPLVLTTLSVIIASYQKNMLCEKIGDPIGILEAVNTACRSSVAFSYYFSFHLLRYYLILLFIIALIFPQLFIWLLASILFIAYIDWKIKAAKLNYFSFTYYYILEQLFYQTGVFLGCCKHRFPRLYAVKIKVTI